MVMGFVGTEGMAMARYSIIMREDQLSISLASKLMDELSALGYLRDDENPEIVFTIGGDGTMLKAVHHYLHRLETVRFIGIHTGKLGFYTDFIPDEMDELISYLKSGTYTDYAFPLLKAKVCKGESCSVYHALNEFTIMNAVRTQHLDVYINAEWFESFQGTGLCISTPSGSSAYNKSLGGALVHPQIKSFQLTEIASINNNVYRTISSPMIFPCDTTLTLKARDFNEVILTIDHEHIELKGYDEIHFSISELQVYFRRFKEDNFWRRVQRAFL